MAMAQVLLHSSSSLGLASLYVNTRAIVPTPEQVRVSRLRSHNCASNGVQLMHSMLIRTPRLCVASRLSKIVQGAQISLRLRVSPNLSSHQVRSPRFHLCTTRAQMDEEAAAAVAASTADSGAPTIFDKIISKQIPSTVVYEDDKSFDLMAHMVEMTAKIVDGFITFWPGGHSSHYYVMVLAFEDVNPQAPVHIVLIPKKRDGLTQLSKATEGNKDILGHLLYAAKLIADQEGLADGFRVVINDGANGCQSVYHLHLHILGGRKLKWPPG